MAQIVKFGNGSASFLKKMLSDIVPKNISLVTGKNSFIYSGTRDKIESILNNYCYFRFFDFEAVESYWSVNSNKESMEYSNKAINIAKMTAPYAILYPFTCYYNILHGKAVALTLPSSLEFNYNITDNDCNDKRGSTFVKKNIEDLFTLINTNSKNPKNILTEFVLSLSIEINIKKLIGNNFDAKFILDNINAERMKTNPRYVLLTFIKDILK